MVAAFRAGDSVLEEVSRNLGANGGITFLGVTLPLAGPGILSSLLLVFTISFSDFGTPIIMAPKNLNLIVVEAYREIAGFFNWSGSAILTVVMVGIAVISQELVGSSRHGLGHALADVGGALVRNPLIVSSLAAPSSTLATSPRRTTSSPTALSGSWAKASGVCSVDSIVTE